jgi:hypothetical protein
MADMDGWVQDVEKVTAKAVPPKAWTTIATITDLPKGPTIIHAQMYGTLPSTKPKNIRTRWLRTGPAPDDATGYTGHVVGTLASWASKDTDLEFIDGTEPPILLQIWHDGGSALTLTTRIEKVLTPGAYIAGRITIG